MARDTFDIYQVALQRFEYFVVGGTGAILAFSVESYDNTLATTFDTLLPITWLSLLISLTAGLFRLERIVGIYRISDMSARSQTRIKYLTTPRRDPTVVLHDLESGAPLTDKEVESELAALKKGLEVGSETIAKQQRSAEKAYWIRNTGLIVGLTLYAAWKAAPILTTLVS